MSEIWAQRRYTELCAISENKFALLHVSLFWGVGLGLASLFPLVTIAGRDLWFPAMAEGPNVHLFSSLNTTNFSGLAPSPYLWVQS